MHTEKKAGEKAWGTRHCSLKLIYYLPSETVHFIEWLNLRNDSNTTSTCPGTFYLRTAYVIKLTYF